MVISNLGVDNYSKIRRAINNLWEDQWDLILRNHALEGILVDLFRKILIDHLGEILVNHVSETLVNHRVMN